MTMRDNYPCPLCGQIHWTAGCPVNPSAPSDELKRNVLGSVGAVFGLKPKPASAPEHSICLPWDKYTALVKERDEFKGLYHTALEQISEYMLYPHPKELREQVARLEASAKDHADDWKRIQDAERKCERLEGERLKKDAGAKYKLEAQYDMLLEERDRWREMAGKLAATVKLYQKADGYFWDNAKYALAEYEALAKEGK